MSLFAGGQANQSSPFGGGAQAKTEGGLFKNIGGQPAPNGGFFGQATSASTGLAA